MKREEELLKPVRELWGSVLWQAVRDYRCSILYGNDEGYAILPGDKKVLYQGDIENELTVMGYGDWLPRIKEATIRVRKYMDKLAPTIQRGEKRYEDCPGCGGRDKLRIWYGRRRVCCHCESCDVAYIYWRG